MRFFGYHVNDYDDNDDFDVDGDDESEYAVTRESDLFHMHLFYGN